MRLPGFCPAANACTVNLVADAVTPGGKRVKFDAVLDSKAKSRHVRIYNAGPSLVFLELQGTDGENQVSPNSGVPLSADREIVLSTGGATFLAATCAQGNATVYATPGEGH